MALQPPSFFEAPQQHGGEGEVGRTVEGDVRSQQGVAGTAGRANILDEVAALRQENQDLKFVECSNIVFYFAKPLSPVLCCLWHAACKNMAAAFY